MTKRGAWVIVVAMTAGVVVGLIFVATLRYPIPLVYPIDPGASWPIPNYTLQAVIALVGGVIAVAACVTVSAAIIRSPRRSARMTWVGSVVIIGIGVIASLLALCLPWL